MRLALDVCCCAGGMSDGLTAAGFMVVGVDIVHHACYPYPMILKDFRKLTYADLEPFAYIHISPPCQQYSRAGALARSRGKAYPDLYNAARRLAIVSGLPYTIENVPGSPAKGLRLYGDMFGLDILRERIFESNILKECNLPRQATGRLITVAGSHARAGENWREAMGFNRKIPDELIKEAVPPAYGKWIGQQVLAWLATGEKLPDYERRPDYEEPGEDEKRRDYEEPAKF